MSLRQANQNNMFEVTCVEEEKGDQCKWSTIKGKVIGNEVVETGKSQAVFIMGQSKKL